MAQFSDLALANSIAMPTFDGDPLNYQSFRRDAHSYCELIGLDDAVNDALGPLLVVVDLAVQKAAVIRNKSLFNLLNLNIRQTGTAEHFRRAKELVDDCVRGDGVGLWSALDKEYNKASDRRADKLHDKLFAMRMQSAGKIKRFFRDISNLERSASLYQ